MIVQKKKSSARCDNVNWQQPKEDYGNLNLKKFQGVEKHHEISSGPKYAHKKLVSRDNDYNFNKKRDSDRCYWKSNVELQNTTSKKLLDFVTLCGEDDPRLPRKNPYFNSDENGETHSNDDEEEVPLRPKNIDLYKFPKDEAVHEKRTTSKRKIRKWWYLIICCICCLNDEPADDKEDDDDTINGPMVSDAV